jgi:hypothetical protein
MNTSLNDLFGGSQRSSPVGAASGLDYLGNLPTSQVRPPTPPTNAIGNPVAGNGFGAPQQQGGIAGTGQNTIGSALSQALGGGGQSVGANLAGAASKLSF